MPTVESVSRCAIEEMLELEVEELSQKIQANCEILINGAMSEWGSKVEDLFQKLKKSVLVWHKEGTPQKITLVFT